MATFSDRLRSVIGERVPHEWAKSHDLRPQKVWDWLNNNRAPQRAQIAGLAKITKIPLDWWLHGDLPPPEPADEAPVLHRVEQPLTGYVAIPLYNGVRAAAGGGALVEYGTPDDMLVFKEQWIRIELGVKPQDLYLIRVAGDSMEPTLRSGDVILVDRCATRPDREGVYILRMKDVLLVKRLQALPGGVVRVISDNAAFVSFDVPIADVGGPDLVIIGRVVWTGRRM